MKLAFLFLVLSLQLFAADFAEVMKFSGKVTFDGKQVKKGQKISKNGEVLTGKKGYLKLQTADKSTIIFGSKSQGVITLKQKKKPLELKEGIIRWISTKGKKTYNGLRTKNAVMGVRGTDFITIRNSLLNETEIVCFDGKVMFQNKSSKNDKALVSKGQWGGLGGRFRNKIGEVIDLPKKVISHFDKVLK